MHRDPLFHILRPWIITNSASHTVYTLCTNCYRTCTLKTNGKRKHNLLLVRHLALVSVRSGQHGSNSHTTCRSATVLTPVTQD